jgi:enoyl-[acyl-carrier protein] reductase II
LDEGELEIGQIAGLIDDISPVSVIFERIISEFLIAKEELRLLQF